VDVVTEDAIVVSGLFLFYFAVVASAEIAVDVAETASSVMAIAVALSGSYLFFVVVVEILAANFLVSSIASIFEGGVVIQRRFFYIKI